MNPLAESEKPTVLLVDDTPQNLSVLSGLFMDFYRVKVATGGARALRIARSDPIPDLILLDVMMPDMDGYEVCRHLKSDPITREIPVIFLTATSDVDSEQRGFELGAEDFIRKPISPPIVLARIKTHLALKASQDFLRDKNVILEAEVLRRTEDLLAAQDVTVLMLASLVETRDNETGAHIQRTQHYVRALAERLKDRPKFSSYLTATRIQLLFQSAALHDIGKVGIPDRILQKPGRLDSEEYEIMKTHTLLGRESIEHAEARFGKSVPFLDMAKSIVYSHHEKWDGSGYPDGIAGEAIPISARLMAVADVYDAITSKRVYKGAMPHDRAVAIIEGESGKHFDPAIVEAFIDLQSEFRAIAARFADPEDEMLANS